MISSLKVSLETPPVPAFAALVQKMVEAAGAQMGLAENDRLRLMLAAEEVFAYLCGSLDRDAVIRCEVADGGWRVGTTLSAEAGSLELGALNVTAQAACPVSGEGKGAGGFGAAGGGPFRGQASSLARGRPV